MVAVSNTMVLVCNAIVSVYYFNMADWNNYVLKKGGSSPLNYYIRLYLKCLYEMFMLIDQLYRCLKVILPYLYSHFSTAGIMDEYVKYAHMPPHRPKLLCVLEPSQPASMKYRPSVTPTKKCMTSFRWVTVCNKWNPKGWWHRGARNTIMNPFIQLNQEHLIFNGYSKAVPLIIPSLCISG